MKHLLDRGVIVVHILEEPLLGELWVGQGLCEGLDRSLHEVVVLGFITCEEVGFITRVYLLSGEVRSVTTALEVVEEMQEEMQEIEDEEEVGWNGELKVEEWRSLHAWMTWDTRTTWALSLEPRDVVCRSWRLEPDYWTMRTSDHECINSRVQVHVCCVEGALGLGGNVVVGVVLGFTTQT